MNVYDMIFCNNRGLKSTAKETYSLAVFLKETVYVDEGIGATGLGDTNANPEGGCYKGCLAFDKLDLSNWNTRVN